MGDFSASYELTQQQRMDNRLAQPLLARLATVSLQTHQPHVVPVWYFWDGESVWVSAFDSTRKVRELRKNPLCSIVIDDDSGNEPGWGVVFEGAAELIKEPSEFVREMSTRIYARYLGAEGVLAEEPQSWISDPQNTIIQLRPKKIFTW